jgi:hypothetical protein
MSHFGMKIRIEKPNFYFISMNCRTVLIANNIRLMSKEMEPKVSINDLKKIRSFSRQRNMVCFKINAKSFRRIISMNRMYSKL